MVTIYLHTFSEPLTDDLFQQHLSCLPASVCYKIMRYRKWEDRHRALFGKLMLLRGLADHGFPDFDLTELTYNDQQKPQLVGNLNFNISHAGQVVVCGFVTKGQIGVDVEIFKPIELEDYEFIFDAETFRELRQSHDPMGAFFEAWTIREAILKAEGSGLTEDAKKIKYKDGLATFKNQKWYVRPFPVPTQHIAHLATSEPEGTVQLVKVG